MAAGVTRRSMRAPASSRSEPPLRVDAAVTVREFARAKINLTLRVRSRRADGYHEIESLVTFGGVQDVVTLEPGVEGSVVVAGPFAQYISGENLLVRALALLREADRRLRLGAVRLEKNLPVAAGLGGGSADAAALLRAVRRADPERAADLPWAEIAARLGADVPVCFGDRPALVSGTGHDVVPIRRLPSMQAVLVNPRVPLPTAQVFASLKAPPAPSNGPSPTRIEFTEEGLLDHMRELGNDLERPAVALLPVIGGIKSALEAQPECRLAAMSGSGPTCFGIFCHGEGARRAADAIAAENPGWWVKSTSLAGAAPA